MCFYPERYDGGMWHVKWMGVEHIRVFVGKQEDLEDPDVFGRIILKSIIKKLV
jgi:hypothetical protein